MRPQLQLRTQLRLRPLRLTLLKQLRAQSLQLKALPARTLSKKLQKAQLQLRTQLRLRPLRLTPQK